MPDQKRKDDHMNDDPKLILMPDAQETRMFTDAAEAVARLQELYATATGFLIEHFIRTVAEGKPATHIRAFYPEIQP